MQNLFDYILGFIHKTINFLGEVGVFAGVFGSLSVYFQWKKHKREQGRYKMDEEMHAIDMERLAEYRQRINNKKNKKRSAKNEY